MSVGQYGYLVHLDSRLHISIDDGSGLNSFLVKITAIEVDFLFEIGPIGEMF